MEKDRFSADMKAARAMTGMSLDDCGKEIGVTGSAVGNWENPEHKSFPRYERWEKIRIVLGINPKEYVAEVKGIVVTGSRSAGSITASSGAEVRIGETNVAMQKPPEGAVMTELTPLEHEILIKFRKFGNAEMLYNCIKKLDAIGAMSG